MSPTPCAGWDAVELTCQEDVYFTLRQTLVCRHDELELFDRAFVAWFLRGPVAPLVRRASARAERAGAIGGVLGPSEDERRAGRRAAPLELGASAPRDPAREGLRGDDARRSSSARAR